MALITLTHTVGCDALEIAGRVADSLEVEIYDDVRLKEEALRMGLRTEELKGFHERATEKGPCGAPAAIRRRPARW